MHLINHESVINYKVQRIASRVSFILSNYRLFHHSILHFFT
ncbi:hypothetical protein RVIR1_05290 [Candidatus Rickettsiella viridis]|uniref:Uncharacterized protein n=1 Tax=Candidatus Rickettsiella viridis TaxID=676208 RepID=A0A2Z5UU94_9COXI|nr:hypothetical protein RVIR1_05290 [Candidatus Rickettsiella viridis]